MKIKHMKKINIVALLIIMIAVALAGAFSNFKLQTVLATEIQPHREQTAEVISYTDIFQGYYEQVQEKSKEFGNNDIVEFEEFCDKYYYSNMDLPTYTNAIISQEVQEQPYNGDSSVIPENRTPANGDANYILSSNHYTVTPASEFARVPIYGFYDYSKVQSGDIIHETNTILWNAGHTAIVYDISKSSVYGDYIQAIEAVGGGVQYGFLDDTRMVDFGVTILRVVGLTANEISSVKNFCLEQVGKPYWLNPLRKVADRNINSENWYCSEMIYVAFRDGAGIDIGVKKDSSGKDVYLQLGCIPSDIYNSYNTRALVVSPAIYLDIAIVSKSGSKWTIKVTNANSNDITFQYNTKMCFEGDAKNWTGLKDIAVKEIPTLSSVNVVISENVFATSITFCWLNQGKQLITYGTNLKTNTSMTVGYVTKG